MVSKIVAILAILALTYLGIQYYQSTQADSESLPAAATSSFDSLSVDKVVSGEIV